MNKAGISAHVDNSPKLPMPVPTRFGYYTSLGSTCETGYQIRRVLGRDDSSFFNWNVTSFESVFKLIESQFCGIMDPINFRYNTDGGLVYDAKLDYFFHSGFPFNQPDLNFFDYPDVITDHQEKGVYLAEKFMQNARGDKPVAYFFKTDEYRAREKSKKLADIIASITNPACGFMLIVLQHTQRFEKDWGIPNVANRYMERNAPILDATDGHVRSWDRVFTEFPHIDTVHLAGFL